MEHFRSTVGDVCSTKLSSREDFDDSGGFGKEKEPGGMRLPPAQAQSSQELLSPGVRGGTAAGTMSHSGLQYQVTPQAPGRTLHQQ